MQTRVTAYAPGSVGNVGPGLDLLGLAVAGLGDEVTLTTGDMAGIIIADPGHASLPRDPARHAAAIAASAVCRVAGIAPAFALTLRKGLPLAGGQGGSAASAVAGAVAANALIEGGLDRDALLAAALEAEAAVAGHHADNVAPSLLGGLILVRSLHPLDVVALPVPESLRIVLVHPDQQLPTRDARAILPEQIDLRVALTQAAAIAAMVTAAFRGDVPAFGAAIDDRIAEPARAPLLPGFIAAKRAALAAGAFGATISGAGPSAFAVVDDPAVGAQVAEAMIAAYRAAGVAATARVAAVDRQGAILR